MKVEYLHDIYKDLNEDDGLVRLYDFEHDEIKNLVDHLSNLISENNSFELTNLSGVVAVNCSLRFEIGKIDLGLQKSQTQSGFNEFVCTLTNESYVSAINNINQYMESKFDGYIWLYDLVTDYELLLSYRGGW